MKALAIAGSVLLVLFLIAIGIYNAPVAPAQRVEQAWADVETAHQRRYDLVPNLVATVKGASEFEERVLTEVTEARASAGKAALTAADLGDPEKVKQFQAAQQALSASLTRFVATAEAYPALKSVDAFRDLMTQLEGTENRIATETHKYNKAVAEYNTVLQTFPSSIGAGWHGYARREPFTAVAEAKNPVKVDFGSAQ